MLRGRVGSICRIADSFTNCCHEGFATLRRLHGPGEDRLEWHHSSIDLSGGIFILGYG